MNATAVGARAPWDWRAASSRATGLFPHAPLTGAGRCATSWAWMTPPQVVTPLIKANTHERADADTMAAAMTPPTMPVMLAKARTPQHIQGLPEVRGRLVNAHTALIHETHGWLGASGIVLPQGVVTCRPAFLGSLSAPSWRTV